MIRIDVSVALMALLGLLCGAEFLLEISGVWEHARKPVATVETTEGFVRRLPHNEWSWDWIRSGTKLSLQETVSTGDQSGARIRFIDGRVLELGPGTMVVIGGEFDKLDWSYVLGGERSRAKRPSLSHKAPWVPSIAASAIRDLSKTLDTHGKFLPKGVTLVLPDEPELLLPEKNRLFDWTLPQARRIPRVPPKLEWKPQPGSRYEVTLKIRRNRSSRPQVVTLKTVDPWIALRNVRTGVYEWSVQAISSEGARSPASESRLFQVRTLADIDRPRVMPVQIKKPEGAR